MESSELLSLSLDFSSHILSPVESSGVWSVHWSPTGLCGGEKSIDLWLNLLADCVVVNDQVCHLLALIDHVLILLSYS